MSISYSRLPLLSFGFTLLRLLALPQNNSTQITNRNRQREVDSLKDLGNENPPNWQTQSKVETTGGLVKKLVVIHRCPKYLGLPYLL